MSDPRLVTVGIVAGVEAARETVHSCLADGHPELEVIVAVTPDATETVAELAGDARVRLIEVAAGETRARARDAILADARGELLTMLEPGETRRPGSLQRQLEVFTRWPDTDVVHGAARRRGAGDDEARTGAPTARRHAMVRSFWTEDEAVIPATVLVRRHVYESLAHDATYAVADRFELLLRAAERFRFRRLAGPPVAAEPTPGAGDEWCREVERALLAGLDRGVPRELVPELDWSLLDEREGVRQALARLADAVQRRERPLVGLAAHLRERAHAIAAPRRLAPSRGRLLMTSFGFDDSGGGTTVPRLAAKELVRRGWEVTVFCAATAPTASGVPYELTESMRDGVRVVGVHNRPHGLFDLGHPDRELDDPPITAAFAALLDELRPDVVHFHNLHNLGAALIDAAASRGVPAHFTTHNYWLICPRAYLIDRAGTICSGPGDGSVCAECVGSFDTAAHERRLAAIRERADRGLARILAVSDAVKHALTSAGYRDELVDVVRQSMPHEAEIWERVGRDRRPGRLADTLTVGFLGSALPHKGPQLLAQAVQQTTAPVNVRVFGEIRPEFAQALERLDRRGRVSLEGAFSPSEIGDLLQTVDAVVLPSLWWDCAPLAAAECLAARTPLVVPRLGGLPEAIRDEVDGLTFNGLDAADLARTLDRLAGEPGLLERLQGAIQAPRAFADYVDELEARYRGDDLPHEAPASPPAVRWQGDHGLPTSLSIINDRVSARLPGPLQRITRDREALDAPLPHPADIEVRHQWPPDLSPARSGRLAIIAPWEFGAVPTEWVSAMRERVDELWVPSEYVRAMYLDAGLEPDRVAVVPNGVDLERFSPRVAPRPGSGELRLLFVGGLIARKGPDLLFDAFTAAFAGRDDVTLVVKDFGADGIYQGGERTAIREHAAAGALPRIELLDAVLPEPELADLYRGCDVLVHPYRGEGFAMPVLEAMACGLPVITTAGGPTDEFCPPQAGWRIRSERRPCADEPRLGPFTTAGIPWMLEPDRAHLIELLHEAAGDAEARSRKGASAREAAERLSWDAVATGYAERIAALVGRPPRAGSDAYDFGDAASVRVLASPAWRGDDALGALLAEWGEATDASTDACLYLLAQPPADGTPEQLERHVLDAAASVDVSLEECADIDIRIEPPRPGLLQRLHAACDGYVVLHDACAGHTRHARRVLSPGTGGLARLLDDRQALKSSLAPPAATSRLGV